MERIVTDAIRDGRTDIRPMNSAPGTPGLYAVPFDVVNPYLIKSCAYCGKSIQKCMVCSRCKNIRYCSTECQVASWKSIHKMYCKNHAAVSIGKLNYDNLFKATNTFSQITVTLREHEGLGQLLESAIGQVLTSQVGRLMILHASIPDMNSMARIISRRLNKIDPSSSDESSFSFDRSQKHHSGTAAAGLLTIAAAMSTMATPDSDTALAKSTPLFRCVGRHYVSYANKFASLNFTSSEDNESKSNSKSNSSSSNSNSSNNMMELYIEGREIFDIPLLSATVNLIHPSITNKNKQQNDLISRCLEVTWDSIEECNVVISNYYSNQVQQQQQPSSSSKEEDGDVNKKSNNTTTTTTTNTSSKCEELFMKHLIKGVLPNLRMLARNLAYIGANPSQKQNFLDRVPKIVMYDVLCLQHSLPDNNDDDNDGDDNTNTTATTKKKKKKKHNHKNSSIKITDIDHEFYQTNIQYWVTTAHNMIEKYDTDNNNNNNNMDAAAAHQQQGQQGGGDDEQRKNGRNNSKNKYDHKNNYGDNEGGNDDDDYDKQMTNLGHYVFAIINKLVLLENTNKAKSGD